MNEKSLKGRPAKSESEKANTRINFRLNGEESKAFSKLMSEADYRSTTKYVKDRLFKQPGFTSQMNDKNLKNIYVSLTKFLQEYHAIGVNFNQLVRKVNSLNETSGIKYDLNYHLKNATEHFEKLEKKQSEILELTSQFYKEWSAK